jgi:hypothetical protein
VAEQGPTIGGFLIKLGEAWELFDAYARDPVHVMTKYGLGEEQQNVLLSCDLETLREELRKELGNEYEDANVQAMIVVKGVVKGVVK